ncbi:hypothetical protein Tco_1045644 [Tanacetum coccineum]|uniref:Uncharacterized protein n=1 Tax=Tanacetum coccineum TaxID=301880 RepID=A0ABQ5GUE3_9ASTR
MVEKFILKFHHLFYHDEEEEMIEDENAYETYKVPKIFRIEGNLFDFETPLCEAYHEFNCLLKIDYDLFTYDIQNFKTYDEYKRELNDGKAKGTEKLWSENRVPYQLCDHICEPYRFKNGGTEGPTCTSDINGFCNGGELPGMVRVGSMTYFQDHRWYDELVDGKLKDEPLALKAKIEGSWGDATPGVVKFCKWLKSCFENFHELEYEVLDKDEGKIHSRTLIDIPVFVGSFSIISGFTIIDDDDMTKDVVLGMKFCKKYASCQMIMKQFAHGDKCERMMENE